jgi:hypothetical protein
LAAEFTRPKDHPLRGDILPISVGTDPNFALKTRKGTGLYKFRRWEFGTGACSGTMAR